MLHLYPIPKLVAHAYCDTNTFILHTSTFSSYFHQMGLYELEICTFRECQHYWQFLCQQCRVSLNQEQCSSSWNLQHRILLEPLFLQDHSLHHQHPLLSTGYHHQGIETGQRIGCHPQQELVEMYLSNSKIVNIVIQLSMHADTFALWHYRLIQYIAMSLYKISFATSVVTMLK